MRDPKVKERAGVPFNVHTPLVEFFGSLHVALLEFGSALLQTLQGFCFRRVYWGRVRCHRGGIACMPFKIVQRQDKV